MRHRLSREGVSNIVAAVFLIAIVLAVTGFLYITFQSLSDAVSSVTAQLAAINRAGRVSLTATSITVTSSSITLNLVNQGSSDVVLTRYYVREYGTNQRWEGNLSELVPAGDTASVSIPGAFNSSASYLIVLVSRDGGLYRFRYPLSTAPGDGVAANRYGLLYAPSILSTYTVAAKGYNSSVTGPINYTDYSIIAGAPTSVSQPIVSAEFRTVYEFPDYKGWAYYKAINIAENTGTDIMNYAIKIVLDTTNFNFTQANPDGSDIRFLGSDKVTLLNYWIQEWDPVAGHAIIWVRVPLLKGGSNTTIYMLYGNPAAMFDPTHHGLLKVMEPLPASDGPNYVIYYELYDAGRQLFEEVKNQGTYQGVWIADNGIWALDLPWSFPYYSSTYSTVFVSSDGYVGTAYVQIDNTSTEAELVSRGMIAPFWAALTTDWFYTGIYVDTSYVDEYGVGVLIRWRAAFENIFKSRHRALVFGDSELNFTVVLYRNGLIRFDYGNISGTSSVDDTPIIGVSYGDGVHYTVISSDGTVATNWVNHTSVILWPRKKANIEPTISIYPAGTGGYSNAVQAYVTSVIFYWRGYVPSTVVNYSVSLYINGPATLYYVTVQALTGVATRLINISSTGPGPFTVEGVANIYFPGDSVNLIVNVSAINVSLNNRFSTDYRNATVTMKVPGDPLLVAAANLSNTLYILDVVSGDWSQVSLSGKLVNPAITFDYGKGTFIIVNGSSVIEYDPLTGIVADAGITLPETARNSAQVMAVGQYIVYAPGGGSADIYILKISDGSVVKAITSPVPIGPYSCSADDPNSGKAYIYVGGYGVLLMINPSENEFTNLPISPAPPTAYPVGMDYGGGYLWVNGRGGGIHYIDLATGEVRAIIDQLPYYPMGEGDRLAYVVVSDTPYLYHVREDGTSEVWIIVVS